MVKSRPRNFPRKEDLTFCVDSACGIFIIHSTKTKICFVSPRLACENQHGKERQDKIGMSQEELIC